YVCFFFMLPLHPDPTLFPYTTLFRPRRAASASPSPGFRQQRKPLRGAPEGLLRGLAPGLETRYRRRSHSRYRDTGPETGFGGGEDRKSTRLNSSHVKISYAVFCLKKK